MGSWGVEQVWPFPWYYINTYLRLNQTAEELRNLVAETETKYLCYGLQYLQRFNGLHMAAQTAKQQMARPLLINEFKGCGRK